MAKVDLTAVETNLITSVKKPDEGKDMEQADFSIKYQEEL